MSRAGWLPLADQRFKPGRCRVFEGLGSLAYDKEGFDSLAAVTQGIPRSGPMTNRAVASASAWRQVGAITETLAS